MMNDLMELMNKLGIPGENIVIREEPEYSRNLLLDFEKQYHLNTSDVVSNMELLEVDNTDLSTWIEAYDNFKQNNGSDDQINSVHEMDFFTDDSLSQKEEMDFVSPSLFI